MIRQQEGTIKTFTQPISISTPEKDFKKAQVVIEYNEKGKGDKMFHKIAAFDKFDAADKFESEWSKIRENFQVGDKVKISFDIGAREGKDKSGNLVYYPQIKLIFMNHVDKSTSDVQESQSNDQADDNQMPEEEDQLPF